MILHESQDLVALDPHRFRVLRCGRRWGKTTEAIEEIKGKAVFNQSHIAYIAPTYQQSRDIAWEALKHEFENIATSINEARLEIRVRNAKNTESIIVLRGWEAIDTLRGQSFDFIVIDEVALMRNFWTKWSEVVRPTLIDRGGEAMFISTPSGYNHFYDLYNLELTDKDFKSFHFSTYDNPFIPREEIEKTKAEMTEERFAQEILAEFKKTEGLVFKEFDRKSNIYSEEPTEYVERIAGVDFGYTNPCAVYSLGITRDGIMWVYEEFYKTRKTDVEVAEYVAACKFNKVYPDPEAPAAIEEMKRRKVNVREVIKGKDSITSGIDKMREMFKAKTLFIHTSCINLISELESYSYPDKGNVEKPIDKYNHAIDAVRYAVMMYTPLMKQKKPMGAFVDNTSKYW